jgi:predicted lipoprotein with Yx(FWY)xxD motif
MTSHTVRNSLVLGTLLLAATAVQAKPDRSSLLTAPNGMTLYVFDQDKVGTSSCYGSCAEKWPAYIAKPDHKLMRDWTVYRRTDGRTQMLYGGQPVYFFVGDTKIGDRNGQGVDGVWRVVRKLPEF